MKNITDLDRGYIGFMLLDKLCAQGLNLKIRHGILMRGEDGSMLPVSTCLQVAGRVGRWGRAPVYSERDVEMVGGPWRRRVLE